MKTYTHTLKNVKTFIETETVKFMTPLDELKEIIANTASIDEEFNRTGNPWGSCYGSKLSAMETWLYVIENSKKVVLLSPEEIKQAYERIEALKERLFVIKEQYPDKHPMPPEDIRKEMIADLNILK